MLKNHPPNPVGISIEELLDLRHSTVPLTTRTHRGITSFPGGIQSRRTGNGLDFYDLRRYQPGDDVRHMDWNVTARTLKPHIRLYHEDREQAFTAAIDMRSCMFTGSKELRSVAASRLASLALWQAARAGDRCGAVVLDNEGISASQPANGQKGILAGLKLIRDCFDNANGSKPRPHSQQALTPLVNWINESRRASGSVLMFTGADEMTEAEQQSLVITGARGRSGCVLVRDSMEVEGLPPGFYPYRSKGKLQSLLLSASQNQKLKSHLNVLYKQKQQAFKQAGIPIFEFISGQSDPKDCLEFAIQQGFL